jgi:phospholipid/cholesterol/gamma-HCH transport system substrate-binding protein
MRLDLPRRAIIVALVFAAVSVALFAFLSARFGGPGLRLSEPLRLHASFADAQGISRGSDVLVRGVKVGRVAAVRGGELELDLDRDAAPSLQRGTFARIGAKTPLGEAFVALDSGHPGGHGAAPRDGGTIATRGSVEVDEALAVLDGGARADLNAALATLARGARSPAASGRVRATLRELDHAVAALDELSATVRGQEGDIAASVASTRALLRPLAERRADVRTLVAGARATLAPGAARGRQLDAALRELPGLLTQAQRTLREVRPLAAEAAAPLDDLRRAAPGLSAALQAAPATLADLAVILRRARPLRRSAQPALRALRGLIPDARPAARRLAPTLADVVPVLDYLAPRANTIAAWFANTDDLGSNGDAKGKWARFFVGFDAASTLGVKLGAPPSNPYTAPDDAAANRAYEPGDFPRLMPYAPALRP